MKKINFLRLICFLFLSTAMLAACNEDDPSPSGNSSNNAYVNDWILENMDFWYLWNDELPAKTNRKLPPDEYFESLLAGEDRFSWIQENYQELLNSLKGVNKEAGYEFVLYREEPGSDNVIAQLLYVKPLSPAANAGLVRGDIISHINGTRISTSNYQELIKGFKENHTITYRSVNAEQETKGDEKTASLSVTQYAENPNYLSKVIEVNDRRIGYFVYNLFAPGPDSVSKVYDEETDAVFGQFKSAGITDLVLDLRFNSGGAESSANNLASLIGSNVSSTKVFARRQYNNNVQQAILNDPELGSDFLTSKFSNKPSNVGGLLNGSRVYILTSSRTASASELVINALKPYMNVFVIGDTTYGKNVGSISLHADNDARNSWGMQPIVVKISNSLDNSDYSSGFVPDVLDKDNSIYLFPLGDPREVLLGHAIDQITGAASGGRKRDRAGRRQMVGHSLDTKRGSYNLIVELPK